MSLTAHDKTISGVTYRVTQLGALKGRSVLVRLVKLAGPGFAAGLSGLGKAESKDVESAMARGLSEALYELAARLSVDEVSGVLDELAASTVLVLTDAREPKLSAVFDLHFAGKYDEMLRWAAFALEVNFKSFFVGSDGSAGMLARLSALVSQASPSPTTSTGTSTG